MIKLSSSLTTWKSPTFTYPVLTGSNGVSVYLNHGLNQYPDSYSVFLLASNDEQLVPSLNRNSNSNLYGHVMSGAGTDLNTVRIDLKRWLGSSNDAYAVLVFYSS